MTCIYCKRRARRVFRPTKTGPVGATWSSVKKPFCRLSRRSIGFRAASVASTAKIFTSSFFFFFYVSQTIRGRTSRENDGTVIVFRYRSRTCSGGPRWKTEINPIVRIPRGRRVQKKKTCAYVVLFYLWRIFIVSREIYFTSLWSAAKWVDMLFYYFFFHEICFVGQTRFEQTWDDKKTVFAS